MMKITCASDRLYKKNLWPCMVPAFDFFARGEMCFFPVFFCYDKVATWLNWRPCDYGKHLPEGISMADVGCLQRVSYGVLCVPCKFKFVGAMGH